LAQWVVTSSAGVATSIAGWVVLSGHARLTQQIPGINVAIIGFVVFGYAQAAWLLKANRRIEDRSSELLRNPADRAEARSDSQPVAVAGLSYYHRPSCPFVADRAATARRWEDHVAAGLLPCPGCQP
jgi:hypothetical protein